MDHPLPRMNFRPWFCLKSLLLCLLHNIAVAVPAAGCFTGRQDPHVASLGGSGWRTGLCLQERAKGEGADIVCYFTGDDGVVIASCDSS